MVTAEALALSEKIFDQSDKAKIMITRSMRAHNRHVRLYRDAGGLYVRYATRGQIKRYLRDMSHALVIDRGEYPLVLFYE